MVDREDNWSNVDGEEDDRDLQEEEGAEHPADPATVPLSPPDMVTVQISKEERLNLSIRAFLLMDDVKVKREAAKKLAGEVKKLTLEIDKIATWVRTGTKEVPNGEQQDLLNQPVGPQAAAQAFGSIAAEAEAATAAAEAEEPPSWKPEHHDQACPSKQGPLHGCTCGWNRANGGPVEGEEFQASEAELSRQSGRGKGKKAA